MSAKKVALVLRIKMVVRQWEPPPKRCVIIPDSLNKKVIGINA